MIEVDNVGIELIHRGWNQGSFLPATSIQKLWFVLATTNEISQNLLSSRDNLNLPGNWVLQKEALHENDLLIVISQPCDIQKPPKHEPYVEIMRAYWTSDRGIIHDARRNSVRQFLLSLCELEDGQEKALIVDATVRLLLDKISLLHLLPQAGFAGDDKVTPQLFRRWLARRYDRPALPDELVNAIQKPIIKAIGKLHPMHDVHSTLDSIGEILFLLRNKALPYQVDLLFIREERNNAPPVNDEQTAKLAGWIAEVLKKRGSAEVCDWSLLSRDEISVKDYENAYELPTDQYSLPHEEQANA